MCETSSDDSNNHVGGVDTNGHNKHVSPKVGSGRVFVCVFVSWFIIYLGLLLLSNPTGSTQN